MKQMFDFLKSMCYDVLEERLKAALEHTFTIGSWQNEDINTHTRKNT